MTDAARRSGVTAGVLAQAAWAALLAHCAGVSDVVHGSAFSGRPAELPAAERIVGPFVNNLPVRVNAAASLTGAELLRQVHGTLTDLAAHQFTALPRIQDCSAVPWRFRLFDSLVVFQNYQIDASLTTLGPATTLGDVDGPIHTNYPLTLVITPRADTWELLLVHQESACSSPRAAALLEDFTTLLLKLAREPAAPLSTLQSACRLPAGVSPAPAAAARPDTAPAAPRNAMEQRLAVIWKRAFGLEEIGVQDNFFDLGGHSLLMLRVHGAICQEIGRSLPVVALFQYPTIAALAVFLEPAPGPSSAGVPVSAPSALKSQTASRAAAATAAAARAAAVRTR